MDPRGKMAYMVMRGQPEGQRSLGRLTYGWEDNIKMDKETTG
jgi:hypothetical protein